MDKQFLVENNLAEAQSRFQSILEYTQRLNEDENDEQMPMGENEQGSEEGPDMGMGEEGQEQPMPAEGEIPMGDDGSQGVPEFSPEGADVDPNAMPVDDIGGEGVEEIDVEDLTDAQETTEKHVKHVSHEIGELSDKLSKVIGLIDKFEADIDANNKSIEDLKAEFEKRNPTNVEKMTLRSKKAYPFGETPEEYWDKKEAEGDYSAEDDENGVNDEKYKITKSDIDSISNWGDIYRSIDNGTYRQSLGDVLGF